MGAGDEVIEWLPTFRPVLNEDLTLQTTLPEDGGESSRFLLLVFKQDGRIEVPKVPACSEDFLNLRFNANGEFKEKYNLEGPVAGNFWRSGHSAYGWTEYYLCFISKCLGNPIISLPGITDVEECQVPDGSRAQ